MFLQLPTSPPPPPSSTTPSTVSNSLLPHSLPALSLSLSLSLSVLFGTAPERWPPSDCFCSLVFLIPSYTHTHTHTHTQGLRFYSPTTLIVSLTHIGLAVLYSLGSSPSRSHT